MYIYHSWIHAQADLNVRCAHMSEGAFLALRFIKNNFKGIYDAKRTKRALVLISDNAGPDQSPHSRRLIWAFVSRLQNQWILQYMSTYR